MKQNSFKSRETRQRDSFEGRIVKRGFLLVLISGLIVLCLRSFWSQSPIEPAEALSEVRSIEEAPAVASKPADAKDNHSELAAVDRSSSTLTPQPMHLIRKVLLDKKWNSDVDALGQTAPRAADGSVRDGSIVGPNSVAVSGDYIYVLDSSGNRLVVYDKAGRMVSSVSLPGTSYGDLVVDPSDSSLFVIDHLNDAIRKVRGGEVSEVASVPLKKDISLGLKFGYDEASGILFVHDYELDGDIPLMINGQSVPPEDRVVQSLAPVKGDFEEQNRQNILLKFKDGQELKIAFDQPVQCVEEIVMDRQGIVWVLYTLDGDFQMRRLARVDPVRGTVGVAPLDVYFLYDSARHMAPSGNGVVVVAGDLERGRLLSFEYSGTF